MPNAPIVLFCYKRLHHLERTLSSLAQNTLAGSSTLYIYADGAKRNAKNPIQEQAEVAAVRKLIKQERWQQSFRKVSLVETMENQGLASAVIRGVSEVVQQHSRVIVLEDDVLVNPYFLEFMNEALDIYRDEEKIGSVRAQAFDLPDMPELFFAQMNGDFAWGTWQRAWQKVSFDGKKLLQDLKQRKLTRQFDYENHYPYTQMLRDQVAGRNSSWGVRFYASLFLQGILTLYPGKALAVHIGYDNGTHFDRQAWSPLDGTLFPDKIPVHKMAVLESKVAREKMKQLFKQEGFASFWLSRQILKAILPSWAIQALRRQRQAHSKPKAQNSHL